MFSTRSRILGRSLLPGTTSPARSCSLSSSIVREDDDDWLAKLHEEYLGVLERMQEPEQKAAAERAFNATPEELGQAAVRAARGKIEQ